MTFNTEIACGGLSMKRLMLLIMLGGLLLAVAGCSSGGGGGGGNDGDVPQNIIPVNMGYTVKNSATSGDYVTMTIINIEVQSNKTLKFNCKWTAVNYSGCEEIVKVSDKDKYIDKTNQTSVYLLANNSSGTTYNHFNGTGAAYNQAVLSTTPVYGTYYFRALGNSVKSIYFCDDDYGVKVGPITVYSD
jgi:hypothetical protein